MLGPRGVSGYRYLRKNLNWKHVCKQISALGVRLNTGVKKPVFQFLGSGTSVVYSIYCTSCLNAYRQIGIKIMGLAALKLGNLDTTTCKLASLIVLLALFSLSVKNWKMDKSTCTAHFVILQKFSKSNNKYILRGVIKIDWVLQIHVWKFGSMHAWDPIACLMNT